MSEVYIGINPIYDSIYGEADAQGLIDKMVGYQHNNNWGEKLLSMMKSLI
jgi:hypothetical protein